jgi:hypothetical protein
VNDRIPLDHLTSDQYDTLCNELAALRAVARGYCPQCGRGDAAPTVTDWERDRKRAEHCFLMNHEKRLAHAEAAIERVRALEPYRMPILGERSRGMQMGWDAALRAVQTALDAPTSATSATEATHHQYLSTGCLHGEHDYCQSNTGLGGAKTPAQCKFCASPCICGCHQTTPEGAR